MSPPILSVFLFTLSLFFLLSTSNVNGDTPSSNPFIKQACSNESIQLDTDLCIRVLESVPKIVATTNFFDFSVMIIETGMSNANDTRNYALNQLKKPNLAPDYKAILTQCSMDFFSSTMSFHSALGEVKGKDFESESYDLKIASTDDMQFCQDKATKPKSKDPVLINGIAYVKVFGLSAFQVVNALDVKSPPSS